MWLFLLLMKGCEIVAELHDDAEKDYISGMKYKEIAAKYSVSMNTVKSWVKRYGWSREKGAHKNKKGCTQKSKVAPVQSEDVEDGTKETIQKSELSAEQQMFCIYYSRTFNASQSYQKAYKCSYESALRSGSRLLKNVGVREEIARLKEIKRQNIMADTEDLIELQMRIAFSDIGNYLTFGRETVDVMGPFGPIKIKNEKTGQEEKLVKEVNTIRLAESSNVDTQIIQEVKQGRDGVSVKLADKQKAMDWLTMYFEANPADIHKREFEKRKLELELLKLEMQVPPDEKEENEQDNFLDALNESAKEVWENGESEK